MNDVFISYARSDRDVAERLAGALQAQDLAVWWDRDLAPGQKFAAVIAQELERARAVVVLWSSASVASNWVIDEASEGQRRNVLVPAVIEAGLQPPLGFRGLHTADLAMWAESPETPKTSESSESPDLPKSPGSRHWGAKAGATSHDEELGDLLTAVIALVRQNPPGPGPTPVPMRRRKPIRAPDPAPKPASGHKTAWTWAGVLAVGAVGVALQQQPEPSPSPAPPSEPEPLSAPAPAPAPAPSPTPAPTPLMPLGASPLQGLGARANPGFNIPLRWRDYIVAYEGRLVWDGGPSAQLQLQAVDMASGRVLTNGTYPALRIQDAATRMVFTSRVFLPAGDSRDARPHEHGIGLVFEQQAGGGWMLRDNCMQAGRPDSCYR